MRRLTEAGRARRLAAGAALALFIGFGPVALLAGAAPEGDPADRAEAAPTGIDLDAVSAQAKALMKKAGDWYTKTPPADRVTWGGLVAAAGLALGVVLERTLRLRLKRVVPDDFNVRFLERLQDGRLDRGKALDYCELHVSPASRVALASVKRWGRPVADLERATSLAHRVEADTIRRHVGTLRRVAALAPLLGLLGTLAAVSRTLGAMGPESGPGVWGPALASALWPLTAGVGLATLALVAYDGLAGKVDQLTDALDRVGAETIDAIALALPLTPVTEPRHAPSQIIGPVPTAGQARTPHQVRMEIPRPSPRSPVLDDDDLD